ncbi:histidine phosphatase family protein [Microbulbifer elongatus]|uniref:histidine phosphatase family protein n=1 Tax=Microbulbifer elongatus TaxID=86173 RepID=UPI001CFE6EBC|nr:histidine phosphatase family protein [Microbulbifer elongatus]
MHQIILIRHGEAAKSAVDADPGLTPQGQQQAEALIASLDASFPGGEGVQLISSPKSRALQTAIPVATHWNKEVQQAEDVIEIPSPMGMSLAGRGAWIRQLLHSNWESLDAAQDQWRKGVIRYLMSLDSHPQSPENAQQIQPHTTLVFCHFMVINSVVAALRNDSKVAQFFPDYTSQTRFGLNKDTLKIIELGKERDASPSHRIQ